jgi:hypothetical protein
LFGNEGRATVAFDLRHHVEQQAEVSLADQIPPSSRDVEQRVADLDKRRPPSQLLGELMLHLRHGAALLGDLGAEVFVDLTGACLARLVAVGRNATPSAQLDRPADPAGRTGRYKGHGVVADLLVSGVHCDPRKLKNKEQDQLLKIISDKDPCLDLWIIAVLVQITFYFSISPDYNVSSVEQRLVNDQIEHRLYVDCATSSFASTASGFMCIHIKIASELVVKQDVNELTNITKPDLLENI